MDTPEKRRWYCPMPGWLVFGSMAVTVLLFLSERWRWFPFNEHKGWTVLIAVAAVGMLLASMLLWFVVATVFRWRFQFSIRSLLVLVVAVALPCSWLAVEMEKAKQQKEAMDELVRLGCSVSRWQVGAKHEPLLYDKPVEPVWLRKLLGDDFFGTVLDLNLAFVPISDAGLERLRGGLPQLRSLNLDDAKITEVGLQHIACFKQLEMLALRGSTVTRLGPLQDLARLEFLDLRETSVNDTEIEHIEGLGQLEFLALDKTHITDAALQHVKSLTRLKTLSLGSTRVSDQGLERIEGLAELQDILLNGSVAVTDEGLKHMKGWTQLAGLHLSGTRISDRGLEQIAGLTRLYWLDISFTAVSDRGLEHLIPLTRLGTLGLSKTRVTDAGLRHLEHLERPNESSPQRHGGNGCRISSCQDACTTRRPAAMPDTNHQRRSETACGLEAAPKPGGQRNPDYRRWRGGLSTGLTRLPC